MHSKLLCSIVAAVSAVVVNVAVVTPAQAQAKAALTRDVDRSTAQPIYRNCRTLPGVVCELYVVPAGKRLVVETVSYELQALPSGPVYRVEFGKREEGYRGLVGITYPNGYNLTPVLVSNNAFTGLLYAATQPLRAYFEEGNAIGAMVSIANGPDQGQLFAFSGYLVDK